METRSVGNFSRATGGILRREVAGDIVMNSLLIWDFSGSGVDKGLKYPPPG